MLPTYRRVARNWLVRNLATRRRSCNDLDPRRDDGTTELHEMRIAWFVSIYHLPSSS